MVGNPSIDSGPWRGNGPAGISPRGFSPPRADVYIRRMCSRYSLTSPPEAVRSYFRYDNEAVFPAALQYRAVAAGRDRAQYASGRARAGARALGAHPGVGQGSRAPSRC